MDKADNRTYNTRTVDRLYLEQGRWKCEKSPTGAHHWIEFVGVGKFRCIYCHAIRRFPTSWGDVRKLTAPSRMADFLMRDYEA